MNIIIIMRGPELLRRGYVMFYVVLIRYVILQ